MIAVHKDRPGIVTFDPWPALAFTAADGMHTVAQFIEHLSSQYEGGPPDGLQEQILGLIQQLVDEKVVRLSETPISLPHYLAVPRSEQDLEKSVEMMKQDGFLEKP